MATVRERMTPEQSRMIAAQIAGRPGTDQLAGRDPNFMQGAGEAERFSGPVRPPPPPKKKPTTARTMAEQIVGRPDLGSAEALAGTSDHPPDRRVDRQTEVIAGGDSRSDLERQYDYLKGTGRLPTGGGSPMSKVGEAKGVIGELRGQYAHNATVMNLLDQLDQRLQPGQSGTPSRLGTADNDRLAGAFTRHEQLVDTYKKAPTPENWSQLQGSAAQLLAATQKAKDPVGYYQFTRMVGQQGQLLDPLFGDPLPPPKGMVTDSAGPRFFRLPPELEARPVNSGPPPVNLTRQPTPLLPRTPEEVLRQRIPAELGTLSPAEDRELQAYLQEMRNAPGQPQARNIGDDFIGSIRSRRAAVPAGPVARQVVPPPKGMVSDQSGFRFRIPFLEDVGPGVSEGEDAGPVSEGPAMARLGPYAIQPPALNARVPHPQEAAQAATWEINAAAAKRPSEAPTAVPQTPPGAKTVPGLNGPKLGGIPYGIPRPPFRAAAEPLGEAYQKPAVGPIASLNYKEPGVLGEKSPAQKSAETSTDIAKRMLAIRQMPGGEPQAPEDHPSLQFRLSDLDEMAPDNEPTGGTAGLIAAVIQGLYEAGKPVDPKVIESLVAIGRGDFGQGGGGGGPTKGSAAPSSGYPVLPRGSPGIAEIRSGGR